MIVWAEPRAMMRAVRAVGTGQRKRSRAGALLLVALVYLLAGAAAAAAGWQLRGLSPLLVTGGADLAGTLVVFAASLGFNNSSFYDPYWSVAPVPIVVFYALTPSVPGSDPIRGIVVIALVGVWAVRLTWNWARAWRGLDHEDWRYVDLRRKTGSAYWLVSLLGLHLLPTVVVFLGLLPLWAALCTGTLPLGWRDLVAAGVTFAAIIIETRADEQLRNFVQSSPAPGAILDSGLWTSSRHPNYFGEISFWWGLYLFAVAAAPAAWWTVVGPLAIGLLFLGITIPLMERHMLAHRPGYAEHIRRVSKLLPWIRRR
jgi:steroid 5-alpha reductase family enzyme